MNSSFFSRRTLNYLFNEVHDLNALLQLPRYADHDREGIDLMLDAT